MWEVRWYCLYPMSYRQVKGKDKYLYRAVNSEIIYYSAVVVAISCSLKNSFLKYSDRNLNSLLNSL